MRKQTNKPVREVRAQRAQRLRVLGLFSLLLLASCSKKPTADATRAASVEAAGATPTAKAPSAAALAPAGALDSCLVGQWQSKQVTLKVDQVSGEGGANVALEIAKSGDSTLDFSEMSDVRASMPAFKFDFRYAGKAKGRLDTPSPGTIRSSDADWAGLRVTATIDMKPMGKMPILKDVPVSQLAAMGSALAGAVSSAAPAAPAAPTPKGIDAAPVFSSSNYSCTPELLTLTPQQATGATWVFARKSG